MELTQKRNISIDLLRGLAALCMILGHSFIIHPIDISKIAWCSALHDIIYSFHMELFFILSGWVYKCVSYKDFVAKKARRMLIPYLFFGLVSMLLHTFGGNLISGTNTISAGITKFLFYGGDYWFIYTLFFLSILYPLLEIVLKRPIHKVFFLVVILFLDCIIEFPKLFMFNAVILYLPYFILGNLINVSGFSSKEDFFARHSLKFLFSSLLFFVGATLVYSHIPYIIRQAFGFVRTVSFCIALYSLVAILHRKAKFVWKYIERLLINASRYSLQLYLFNGYILVAARVLICSILHIHIPIVIVLFIFLSNVFITLFVCKKILPKSSLLRTICGM